MSVLDPIQWPWKDSDAFGRLMPRAEALVDDRIDRFHEEADLVDVQDPGIRAYLEGETT